MSDIIGGFKLNLSEQEQVTWATMLNGATVHRLPVDGLDLANMICWLREFANSCELASAQASTTEQAESLKFRASIIGETCDRLDKGLRDKAKSVKWPLMIGKNLHGKLRINGFRYYQIGNKGNVSCNVFNPKGASVWCDPLPPTEQQIDQLLSDWNLSEK